MVDSDAITAELNTSLQLINASISTVGNSLENSSPIVLATVYQAVQDNLAPFLAAINTYDTDIDTTSVGGVVSGLPAVQLATALVNQADDMAAQANLIVTQAYVARVGVNILNATG